jgi:hypothetical protein
LAEGLRGKAESLQRIAPQGVQRVDCFSPLTF